MRRRAAGVRASGRRSFGRPPGERLNALEVDALHLAANHALDDHAEAIEGELLAGARHAPESLVDEPADGRHVLAPELVVERRRELVQRQAAGHPELAPFLLLDG